MASNILRNPQAPKQKKPERLTSTTGTGKMINPIDTKGSGKIINGFDAPVKSAKSGLTKEKKGGK